MIFLFISTMKDNKLLLGESIMQVRKMRKMSQADLASQIRCSKYYLSKIEKGRIYPSNDFINRIGIALEIPTAILFIKALKEEMLENDKAKNRFNILMPTINSLINEIFQLEEINDLQRRLSLFETI